MSIPPKYVENVRATSVLSGEGARADESTATRPTGSVVVVDVVLIDVVVPVDAGAGRLWSGVADVRE